MQEIINYLFLSLDKCVDELLSEQPSCSSTKLSRVMQENLDNVIGNVLSDAWVSSLTNHENS